MMKSLYCRIAPLAVALLATILLASVAAACPTCKEGLDQTDPRHNSIAAGFYYSIIFMMSMPFIILGSFGCLAFLSIRRAKEQQGIDGTRDGIQETGLVE